MAAVGPLLTKFTPVDDWPLRWCDCALPCMEDAANISEDNIHHTAHQLARRIVGFIAAEMVLKPEDYALYARMTGGKLDLSLSYYTVTGISYIWLYIDPALHAPRRKTFQRNPREKGNTAVTEARSVGRRVVVFPGPGSPVERMGREIRPLVRWALHERRLHNALDRLWVLSQQEIERSSSAIFFHLYEAEANRTRRDGNYDTMSLADAKAWIAWIETLAKRS